MQNLEIKAWYTDFENAQRLSDAIGARKMWTKRQVDSYFVTKAGKLKLRQVENAPAELIAYQRPNAAAAALSDYFIYTSQNSDVLRQCLEHALGIDVNVVKTRTLYLWKNVRIHLDKVDGLGAFIEFEAVLDDHESPGTSQERIEFLLTHFQIQEHQLIDVGYYELLKEKS